MLKLLEHTIIKFNNNNQLYNLTTLTARLGLNPKKNGFPNFLNLRLPSFCKQASITKVPQKKEQRLKRVVVKSNEEQWILLFNTTLNLKNIFATFTTHKEANNQSAKGKFPRSTFTRSSADFERGNTCGEKMRPFSKSCLNQPHVSRRFWSPLLGTLDLHFRYEL